MTLQWPTFADRASARSLLLQLVEAPDLPQVVQALSEPEFAALIRQIGVEDAGELVALATKEQLVQAFDEDLFVNARPGKRETLDTQRFATWLEVLLEAGEHRAARRIAEIDEDFLAHALSGLIVVFDEDALRERLDEGDPDDIRQAEKALESALSQELDGYVLVAREHSGWDATLGLLLALDQDHRALLERLLDHLARVASHHLDDLDELTTVLTEGESLAEDVEAAREVRRSKEGYVEPRAARAFLALARATRSGQEPDQQARDPLSHAYFRELERHAGVVRATEGARTRSPVLAPLLALEQDERRYDERRSLAANALVISEVGEGGDPTRPLLAALRELSATQPELFGTRIQELVYLANVLLAGAELDGDRMNAAQAAQAALCTVCYGAVLELRAQGAVQGDAPLMAQAFVELLRARPIDLLFRRASRALATRNGPNVPQGRAWLSSADELRWALG